MNAKDMLLRDAVECAIEANRKIIKLERVIAVLSVVCVLLIAGYML